MARLICPEEVPRHEWCGGMWYKNLVDDLDAVVGICWQPAGSEHEAHWHDAPELYVVLEGSAQTLTEDGMVEIRAGESLEIPGRAIHNTIAGPDGMLFLFFFPDGPQETRCYCWTHEKCPGVGSPCVRGCGEGKGNKRKAIVDGETWRQEVVTLPRPGAMLTKGHRFVYVHSGEVVVAGITAKAGQLVDLGSRGDNKLLKTKQDGTSVVFCTPLQSPSSDSETSSVTSERIDYLN